MTKIIIKKTTDGYYKSFTCTGHSGFSESGKDIVCAAISVLVINAINSLKELAGEDLEITTDERTGFIGCNIAGHLSEQGKLLMDSMILGLSGIENQYGKKYLDLKFKEV